TRLRWPAQERRWVFWDHLQREAFAVSGLLTLSAAYAFIALRPCWIACADSPWGEFLRPELSRFVTLNELWNIRFARLAYYGSHAAMFPLWATFACRIGRWLPAAVPRGFARACRLAFVGAVALACLWIIAALVPDVFGPWAGRLILGYVPLLVGLS